eukprot:CAMPEP_0119307898 /NCGR_PEP_ID=MMETSP1333-20130426/8266_1 /TAXON_ID=418940 /ORGANISM="Scyphosphaera apsteinii, Strain RCC1455" /LENGTH=414 /DNA_ID=CAMNT_0007311545 /DNA_START=5 /DNA_END=1250 /DNA_ORIENTATION=+
MTGEEVPSKKSKRKRAASTVDVHITALQVYEDEDESERFYTLDWGIYAAGSCTALLAIAGELRHIKVLDCHHGHVLSVLQGHGSAIHEVRFHPVQRQLLLSASQDESVRLWDFLARDCIAIFAGDQGHLDAVLSLDVRADGKLFASCGVDGTIKVWDLESDLLKARVEAVAIDPCNEISPSSQPAPPEHAPLPLFEQFPLCTVDHIHVEQKVDETKRLRFYVDCVRWVGPMILSRAADERAVLWQPAVSSARPMNESYRTPLGTSVDMLTSDRASTSSLAAMDDAMRGGSELGNMPSHVTGYVPSGAAAGDAACATCGDGSSGDGSGGDGSGGDGSGAAHDKKMVKVLREFRIDHSNIWFLRFQMDLNRTTIALGNVRGQVGVWSLDEPSRALAMLSLRRAEKNAQPVKCVSLL